MKPVFLDTSFLIAIARPNDAFHGAAMALRTMQDGPLVTTEHILAEVLDALSHPRRRMTAIRMVDAIRASANVQIVPVGPDLFNAALALYRSRPDKSWGLTDCISFNVMHRAGITHALTADNHFEQAGFVALIK